MKRFAGLLYFVGVLFVISDLGGGLSIAQDDENMTTLKPVVVSASRLSMGFDETSGSFTIIDRDDIKKMKASSMVDVLRSVPGLHIDQKGGRGGLSSVYLRGSDPNFTPVLIDGVKVNDPTNARGGSFDFSTLNVANIERVEVVRGPISAIHGSDAMAGVINIITRHGKQKPEYSMGFSGGSEGYYSGNVFAGGPLSAKGDYAISAAYLNNGDPVEGDEFHGNEINFKMNVFPFDNIDFNGNIRYSNTHSESFPDDSGGPKYSVLRGVDTRDPEEFTAGAEIRSRSFKWIELDLKLSWYDKKEDTSSPGVAPGLRDPFGIPVNSSVNRYRRTQLSASAIVSALKNFKSIIGMDAQFEKGKSDNTLVMFGFPITSRFEKRRETYSPFLEIEYMTPVGLTVQGALRADIPEDFSTEYSPRLGLIYNINSTGTTLKANWGKGFKLPSLYALSNPIVGNADLAPETSKGYDLGVVQKFFDDRISMSVTPFYNRFHNIIDFDPGPPPKLVNRSNVTAKGVEWGLDIRPFDNLAFNGHLTYSDTNIKGTHEKMLNRPKWRGGINVQYQPESRLNLNLNILYVGKIYDSSIPTGDVVLDNYYRTDIAAVWAPVHHLELGFAIDNLFDVYYEDTIGFQAPGIRPRFSVRLIF